MPDGYSGFQGMGGAGGRSGLTGHRTPFLILSPRVWSTFLQYWKNVDQHRFGHLAAGSAACSCSPGHAAAQAHAGSLGLDAYSVIFTNPCWTSWVVLAMASVLTLIPGIRSSFP